ncbi:MAG: DNA-protecting protein DprA [Desulfosudis oleivorans]|nr:DNA-protecting protein DprA [Desulfosudis oleivorans]
MWAPEEHLFEGIEYGRKDCPDTLFRRHYRSKRPRTGDRCCCAQRRLKEKGKTVGVLGCGIDICYPSENRSLFEKVGKEGCILTEYTPGELPLQHHFPARNRIIAGLSKGVLVVEASQRSGSLITARLGLEYGREVMAIPGSIFDEGYKGANSLIKQGAKLIDGMDDIIATCFPNLTLKKTSTLI